MQDPGVKLLAIIVTLAATFAGCAPDAQENASSENAAGKESVLNNFVPAPQPPMKRSELLLAVARAASAEAAGADGRESQRSLDGRDFEFRIRFGCRGPAADLSSRSLGWSFDDEDRTIRVRAMPTIARDDAVVARIGGDEFEAVEGFWIPRPWLLEPACPAAAAVRPAPAEPAEAAEKRAPQAAADDQEADPSAVGPRVGIAHFFTSTDPRTGRRGNRPYEAVKSLPPDQPVGSQGYDLVLAGRLRSLPGRGVIVCAGNGADEPPDCIVSAELDRAWVERPDTGEVLAQWTSG